MKYEPVSVSAILNGWVSGEIVRYEASKIPEILFKMNRGELSREQLITVITVRYQAAHFFEDMLHEMLRIVAKGKYRKGTCWLDPGVIQAFRKAIATNLSDELGNVNSYGGGPHREGRKVFLSALGVDYEAWKQPLGTYDSLGKVDEAARSLIVHLRWIIGHGAIEALAVLWYYECRIALDRRHGDYHILLRAFEGQFPEFKKPDRSYREGDVLWHLHSHAAHDEYHAKLAENALSTLEEFPGVWRESMEFGFQETLCAFENFWNGLSEQMFGRFNSTEHWGKPPFCAV